ncbi:DUF494 family protein [Chitinibacteraceae bacterium HSL-7]
MLDVLAYLFETFFHAEEMPDVPQLASELSAAGFAEDDIGAAMAWLGELARLDRRRYSALSGRFLERTLLPDELARLTDDAVHYWYQLTRSGALDAAQSEMVLDRMHLSDADVIDAEHLKRWVLMAVWGQNNAHAGLLVDDILFGGASPVLH